MNPNDANNSMNQQTGAQQSNAQQPMQQPAQPSQYQQPAQPVQPQAQQPMQQAAPSLPLQPQMPAQQAQQSAQAQQGFQQQQSFQGPQFNQAPQFAQGPQPGPQFSQQQAQQGFQQGQPNFQMPEAIPADTPMAQHVTFSQAISLGFHNYTRFRGGASMTEFWFWQLFCVIMAIASSILNVLLEAIAPVFGIGTVLSAIIGLVLLLPTITVSVRRLHDAGYTGYLYFISLIPFGGSIVVLVLCAMKPKRPLPAGWWEK